MGCVPGSVAQEHNLFIDRCCMKNHGLVSGSDRFYFGGKIVFRSCHEGWLAISVETANWIVLTSDIQRSMLEQLIDEWTVGEVYNTLDSESSRDELKKLLASITARDFARIDQRPLPQFLEGYKMLNCYITNACNLRCKHCFMNSGVSLKNELSLSEWEHVLSCFKKAGGESVTFSGGEPLMKKSFLDIVKFAHNLELSVTVLTNGLLWSCKMIEDIAPYVSEVQISIDGVDESSNAVVRGAGHFDKVVESVIAFANAGVRTSVATTFTFDNLQGDSPILYKSMVEVIKSCCKNPVFFKLSKKILSGRGTHYSEEQNKEFYNKILEIEKAVDKDATFNNFMGGHTPNLVTKNCGFGGISIGADGEVYFCNRISEVDSYGNVRDNDIEYFMKKGHDLYMATSVDNINPCRNCHLKYICSGGCRIDDCNIKGRLSKDDEEIIQIKCNDDYINSLERKMIDSFMYYYKF